MSALLNRSWFLPIVDVIGLFAAFNIAYKLRFGFLPSLLAESLWILVIVAIVTLYVMDVYRMDSSRDPLAFSLESFVAVIVIAGVSMVIVYILGVSKFKPIFGRGVLPVALMLFSVWAPLTRWILANWYKRSFGVLNWLIVSSEKVFQNFLEDGEKEGAGIVTKQNVAWINPGDGAGKISKWINEHPTRPGIIFDNASELDSSVFGQLRDSDSIISVLSLTDFYEQYWAKLPVANIEENWLRPGGRNLLHDRTGIRIKRVFDILAAVIALILLIPLMVLIGVLIYANSPGNVIYRQQRVGLNEKLFVLYKFRSMVVDAEKSGVQWAGVNDSRTTKVGKFLRATRMDELPQLWNLVLGNMSLIGPRPERPEFVSRLEEEIPYYKMRHVVPPGITGWAQVKYPYGASVDDAKNKLEYDLYYIKNHSIRLDITIIVKTILVVVKGLGR